MDFALIMAGIRNAVVAVEPGKPPKQSLNLVGEEACSTCRG